MADTVKTYTVTLSAGVTSFVSGFQQAEKEADKLYKQAKDLGEVLEPLGATLGAGLGALSAGAVAIGGAFVEATKQTLEYADAIGTAAERTGHSTDWLQEMGFAAKQSGTDLELVVGSSEKLSKNLEEGSVKTQHAVSALGLSFKDLRNASPDQQMNMVLKALQGIESPSLRSAAAMELFGKAGGALLPLIGNFDVLGKRAKELGAVLSKEDVAAGKQLHDQMAGLGEVILGAVRNFGTAVTGSAAVHEAVEILTQAFGDMSKWVLANRDNIRSLVVDGMQLLVNGISLTIQGLGLLNDGWAEASIEALTLVKAFANLADGAALVARVLAHPLDVKNAWADYQRSVTLTGVVIDQQVQKIRSGQASVAAALLTGAGVTEKLSGALDRLGTSSVKAGKATEDETNRHHLQTEEMLKAAEAAQKLSLELDKALGEAAAQGLTGIQQAFAKNETVIADWSNKVSVLVKKGLAADEADDLRSKIEKLSAALKENAVQAERQKVLGDGLKQATAAMDNAVDTVSRFGGVAQLSDAQLVKLVNDLQKSAAAGGQSAAGQELLSSAMAEAAARGDHVASAVGFIGENAVKSFDKAEKAEVALEQRMQHLAQVISDVGGGFQILGQIGQDVGGKVGNVMDQVGQFGANVAEGFATGDFTKAFDQALGFIVKGIGSLFHSEEEQVNKLRDSLFAAKDSFQGAGDGWKNFQQELAASGLNAAAIVQKIFDAKTVKQYNETVAGAQKELSGMNDLIQKNGGTLDELKKRAAEAHISLTALFNPKSPADFLSEVKKVQDALDTQADAQKALQDAVDRYKISVEELGPAMQKQKLGEQASQLYQDFKVLTASGIDVNTVMKKMGPNLSDFVKTSLAAGQAIPQAMKPMIDQFIASGQLLDANGKAYTSAEQAGITYSQTMDEMFTTLIEKVDQLVSAITGIPTEKKTTVTVDYKTNGSPAPPNNGGPPPNIPIPPNLQSFAEGTMGWRYFGDGTMAMLHGWEAVVPREKASDFAAAVGGGAGGGMSVTINAPISENPLQTAENVRQMRDFTVRTMGRETARSLAAAVAAGRA